MLLFFTHLSQWNDTFRSLSFVFITCDCSGEAPKILKHVIVLFVNSVD